MPVEVNLNVASDSLTRTARNFKLNSNSRARPTRSHGPPGLARVSSSLTLEKQFLLSTAANPILERPDKRILEPPAGIRVAYLRALTMPCGSMRNLTDMPLSKSA